MMSESGERDDPYSDEQALPPVEERYRLIEENVRDYAIFTLDTQNRISSWNIGAERMMGFTPDEALGQHGAMIFTPEDRERGDVDKELSIARDTGRAENERWHLRKDGSRFWGSGIMTGLRGEDGRFRGYVKIMRDFTERKRVQEELQSHREQIELLNARLRRAMAETHHRVKNNLQVVAALVDMQLLEAIDAVPAHEVARLGMHIRTLAAIHDLLTDVAKTDVGTGTVSSQSVLDRLLPMIQQTAGSRLVHFDIHDVQLPYRHGTSVAVLVNELVSNAVKHGQGEITVSLTAVADEARLEVCDQGIGFPRNFNPRSRANTGLELVESISRWDLSGQTDYRNRPEGGTRVTVIFPIPASEEW
jgi:PAS domain S-box-containing protein